MHTDAWILLVLAALSAPLLVHDIHATNENLYVSAENPRFENHFAGSMVVEVVVSDPDLRDVGEATAEPDVTVNGRDLRMVQATDGAWYAYFAHVDAARAADQIVADLGLPGTSLDFGEFCGSGTDGDILGTGFSDTEGVAVPRDGLVAGTHGEERFVSCGADPVDGDRVLNNVVRSPKRINTAPGVLPGQIGLDAGAWPVVQLFSFNDVEVEYRKPGGTQSVDLTYGEIPNIGLRLDRSTYPSGSEVFVTIYDAQLNQDPTDEDHWTFNVHSPAAALYQVGDEPSDTGAGKRLADLGPHLESLGFEDNGQLTMDPGQIIDLKTNRNQPSGSVSDGTGTLSNIVTFAETRPNSGIFQSYDNTKTSTIGILPDAPRGLTGTITYNDRSRSILSGTFEGSVSIGADAGLTPGTRSTVTITDEDQNTSSAVRDSLDVSRASAAVPTLKLGDPLTLRAGSDVRIYASSDARLEGGTAVHSYASVDSSERLIIDTAGMSGAGFEKISINTGHTADSIDSLLIGADARGTNWLNYDLRSVGNHLDAADFSDMSMDLYFGLDDASPVRVLDAGDVSSATGLMRIDDHTADLIGAKSGTAFLVIDLDTSRDTATHGGEPGRRPLVVDLFSFGVRGTEEINNAIYRFELEETSNNSGTFEGTIEYVVTNQVNILDADFVSGLSTIGRDVKLLVAGDLLDDRGITISYLDQAGAPGVRSAKSDVRTHSGTVATDSQSYRFGQPVTITLNDPDLNQNHETIESYHVVNDPASPAVDTVGSGDEILLEIKIRDVRYERCMIDGVSYGGLAASGFALVETGADTGVFEGVFKMPSMICNRDGAELISPAGGSVTANYHDFRDSSGGQNIFALSGLQRSSGELDLNAERFVLPRYKQTVDVVLSGTLENPGRGTPLTVLFHAPDGATESFGVATTGRGDYMAVFTLRHNSPVGTYVIEVIDRDRPVGSVQFTLDSQEIPSWIRNSAGWWSDGLASDEEFASGVRHLIDVDAAYSESGDPVLPDWVKGPAKWWSGGLIPDDEFISGLEFLVKKGIIKV